MTMMTSDDAVDDDDHDDHDNNGDGDDDAPSLLFVAAWLNYAVCSTPPAELLESAAR
jgi:hypothetical protein